MSIPNKSGYDIVNKFDILYLKSDDACCWVYLRSGEKKLVTKTLKEITSQLDERKFIRIHHSYVIISQLMKSYSKSDGGSVTLVDGSIIPVSRARKETLIELIRDKQ